MRMMTDEDELAVRAGAGDAQAFRALLENHYDRIYRLAYRFFGNQADAEDIAQDVCLTLPKKLKSFAARARFSTWIYQVVINACRDQARSQNSRRALNDSYGQVSELTKAADRETAEQIDWLYAALDTLNPQLTRNRHISTRRRHDPRPSRRRIGHQGINCLVADARTAQGTESTG